MVNDQITRILQAHNLRQTDSRRDVLRVFLNTSVALVHADLEEALGEAYDRVTLYRTLTAFLDQGVIHKIPDDSGAARYALCSPECDTEQHRDDHIHFKCVECGTTECLEGLNIPNIRMPKGYLPIQSNFLIEGVCKKCSAAVTANC